MSGSVAVLYVNRQGKKPMERKKGPMANKEESSCYTVNELARYFNVDPKTIYRRLWARQIPAYKVGRIWKIARKDLVWLRK